MIAPQRGVVILHNDPQRYGRGGRPKWAESEGGVLDEVRAVAEAMGQLRVPWRRQGVADLADLKAMLAHADEDVIFNLVEGLATGSADVNAVPAICRAFGKACTGNETICLDKWVTKAQLRAHGVPTPPAAVVPVGAKITPGEMPTGPLIVKPLQADGSEGIDTASLAPGPGRTLQRAVRRVHRDFRQPALVEQFIEGREVNVSLLPAEGRLRVLPLAEIDFSAFGPDRPRIVDYAAKWRADTFEYQNTPLKIPADLPAAVARALRRAVRAAFQATGCQGYTRVDCRVDPQGRVYVIEVNPNPDISLDAGFAAALAAAKISYADFIRTVLRNAERRQGPVGRPARPNSAPGVPAGEWKIRRSKLGDRKGILKLVAETGLFRPGEIEVAREILDDALRDGAGGHYQSYTATAAGGAIGWVCFGPTPCTEGTFDLYWIAVDPRRQGRGVGRTLMRHAEDVIARSSGRLVVVETSGREDYRHTRTFYAGIGYREVSRVPDFYAPGDPKIIYAKRIDPH